MREDERELVERARGGDAAAVGELFARYWRAARAAAFGVTGELSSAEDAAADAFRQAWAGLASLRDPDRFGPWLRTIVVRRAALVRQSRRAQPDVLRDDLPDSGERPDHVLERLEATALIQQAVRELPPRLREAVSLFYFEGYDSDAAARFLGVPPGTFRRRLHDGRRQLRIAADHILNGRKTMNGKRDRAIERLQRLVERADEGDGEPFYQALRGALALRPAPIELIGALVRRRAESRGSTHPRAPELPQFVRETVRLFTGPSIRALDPEQAVGAMAAAIRRALPDFQDWTIDAGAAAARVLTFRTEPGEHPQAVLPPGFADGQPGAFVRATRALLIAGENGAVRTTYQLLEDSATAHTFRDAMRGARLSDVLDLTWMVQGSLDLRSVQAVVEGLIAVVLPGARHRFASCDEPRYRSAFRLYLGDLAAPAATGGVLAGWPGQPQGVEAAHVRLFLEPWATMHSGRVVGFEEVPRFRMD